MKSAVIWIAISFAAEAAAQMTVLAGVAVGTAAAMRVILGG